MIGYFDLPSGISGDMFLGCLIDAGWPIDQLRATLEKLRLPAQDWSVDARTIMKGPFRATLADVKVTEGPKPVAHQFVLAPGHDHGHTHRNLNDIRGIIQQSDLPPAVKQRSIAVFVRLAHAEAKVHGTDVQNIHFHEVGALDAIVDIVGTVAGLHGLGVEQLYASALPMGHGWIDSQHGKLPLPAPATLELLSAANAPTCPAPGPGNSSPTARALVCELAKFSQPAMRLQKIAIGAGQRDTAWPNVARLWLGTAEPAGSDASSQGSIVQIETNIDDMNPQFYGPLSDRLFSAGALDVWLTPIQMKKNRPAITLSVLAPASAQRNIADLILRETTTLGVRMHPVHRFEAEREFQNVVTPFGNVRIKLKKWGGQVIGAMPEYEDCRRIAESRNVPVKAVYDAALIAAHQLVAKTDESHAT